MSTPPVRPPAANVRNGRPAGVDPARVAGLLARTWLEVRCHRRPLRQLAPLVTPAVARRLSAQLRRSRGTRPPTSARVTRVVASHPTVHACEAVVLVEQDGRTTAVAVRLERHRGSWRAVDLSAPEDGLAGLSVTGSDRRRAPSTRVGVPPPRHSAAW